MTHIASALMTPGGIVRQSVTPQFSENPGQLKVLNIRLSSEDEVYRAVEDLRGDAGEIEGEVKLEIETSDRWLKPIAAPGHSFGETMALCDIAETLIAGGAHLVELLDSEQEQDEYVESLHHEQKYL